MATSSRLRGNVNPIFTMKLGAGTATSYADDLKKWTLSPVDKPDSDLTFAEAAAGLGQDFVLKLTTLVSFDAGALFGYVWDNSGATVDIVFGPYGNAAPSATKPHFTFTAVLPGKPEMGNEARTSLEGADTELEIKATTTIVKKIA